MKKMLPLCFVCIVLFAALMPLLFHPRSQGAQRLVLLSPHWDGIRTEFGRAFEDYWKLKTGEALQVEFYDVGGGGEIRRYIQERFKGKRLDQGEHIGVDLVFGGGTFDYRNFSKQGLLEPYTPQAVRDGKIPASLNGQPLYDEAHLWHAACLSGFGLVYNRLVLEKARLPTPATWEDLARPEFQGWISCGDPTRSSSLHMAFEIVLQAYGFEKGFSVLARLCANAPAFNEGGGSVPRDVALGQAAAGPCIDFYAAAPVRRQGASHLVFVFPQGLSVVTPDAIGMLKNAPNRAAAEAFIDFVLAETGQRLWYQKQGSPGGPHAFDLERLPVWPELYERQLPTYTVARPFDTSASFDYDDAKGGRRWGIVEDLFRATLVDLHLDLQLAWKAIVKAGLTEALGPQLGQSPVSEQELFDLAAQHLPRSELNRIRRIWTGWAREHYRKLRLQAEGSKSSGYDR